MACGTAVNIELHPCFELWLVLHPEDLQKFVDTDKAERHSRKLDGRCGKSIDAARYLPMRWTAAQRAQLLEQRHSRNGVALPRDNPLSGMHRFLRALEQPRPHARGGGQCVSRQRTMNDRSNTMTISPVDLVPVVSTVTMPFPGRDPDSRVARMRLVA